VGSIVGLPLALKAHRQGDLVQAAAHYQRALDQQVREPVLFQNYGALLRSQGNSTAAESVYNQGLALFPHHPSILCNRANLLRQSRPASAVADSLDALRQFMAEGPNTKGLSGAWITTLSQLRELQLYSWALALAQKGLGLLGADPQLLLQILLIFEALDSQESTISLGEADAEVIRSQIDTQLESCEPLVQAEICLGLAAHRLGRGELTQALAQFEQAMAVLHQPCSSADIEEGEKRQKLVDVNSWNFGIALLKKEYLERGWKLFDYGLRCPAEGQQRWQRAMRKPFGAASIPLWRGESLQGKRLLLLEEQAIGDAMMFLSLVPSLLEEADSIGILMCDRLLPIYRRSMMELGFGERLKIWSYSDSKSGTLRPETYDLQSPIGSICQHRFTSVNHYARHTPLLKAKAQRVEQFRREYLKQGQPAERLIGISWQGGGKGVRIQQKSISSERFAQLLQPMPGIRFVSLQYGNAAPTVDQWRQQGLDVIHDGRVNPLKQMDIWLAQVAACDAVLSVANTTIHGAGGLGLPTLCLLSLHSDWRWFDDPAVTRSYWYPSVGIAREERATGWNQALLQARSWLEDGCPMPIGPVSTASG